MKTPVEKPAAIPELAFICKGWKKIVGPALVSEVFIAITTSLLF